MIIENRWLIDKFVRKHAGARMRMAEWIEKVEAARWHNFTDIRHTFNSADYVRSLVVFNIGGNNYRIVAEVIYIAQIVRITKVGTHKDYDGWKL